MRAWDQSTFVFVSTNHVHVPGGIEDRWLDVMRELKRLGAHVHFLCPIGDPAGEVARAEGITVAPYLLDRWNVIRSRSRLRKYLRRYDPICVHSTGVEADLMTRWAARKLPRTCVATTLAAEPPAATRRKRPVDAFMRRWDLLGIRSSDIVFVECEELIGLLKIHKVPENDVVVDPPDGAEGQRMSVARHIEVYRGFMAHRGSE